MMGVIADFFNAFGALATYLFKKDKESPVRSYLFRASALGLVAYGVWWNELLVPLFLVSATWMRELMPLWVPIVLIVVFAHLWVWYVRTVFFEKTGYVLLEIKLPREIMRSPKAMELFFSSTIWSRGSVTFVDTFWDGKVGPWYSFEIASFGGDVHFYIWVWPKLRKIVETQIYAQYPTVEINETPDYAARYPYGPEGRFMWGTHIKLAKPDPYPIKTYIDYGLDKEEEEEIKVDPITPMLEFLGGLNKGEQCWIQILARAHQERSLVHGHLFKRPDWKDEAQELINEILMRDPKTKSTRKESATGFPIMPTLTDGEKEQVEAIERSLNKHAYECMIRALYFAEGDAQSEIPKSIPGLIGSFRQYNANNFNGFKLGWYNDISDETKDILWFTGLRDKVSEYFMKIYGRQLYDAYRRRSFFYYPYKNFHVDKPFILTAEELATIYHFPGKVAATPTIGRAPSRKAEPPPNLPI
ncbi:MAG: hypothetical protein G01um101417_379 [Parcubacteria group bacterium Gr01-1014_17]|nr:MAG: hypothetical protein G01um101417_379 [Parcubacteria group bacterium Gr01-1014_17]